MSKIYDCFLFFNELDLLEIRLELLYNYVDYFIISECDSTFSGLSKEFIFENNKDKFTKYLNKIIYIKHSNSNIIENIPNPYINNSKKYSILKKIIHNYNNIQYSSITGYGQPHWCRDHLHREYLLLGMDICEEDDIIMFSDLDELPDPSRILLNGNTYALKQKNIIYYINKENITENWIGNIICKYSFIKNQSLNNLRHLSKTPGNIEYIDNSGWHLTFMGGKDRIKSKIESYGHQEFNNQNIKSQIEDNLKLNRDVLYRNINIVQIDPNELYPSHILNLIKNKFPYLIYESN
jgi:beta-1,4-mannosyl-glycoprotein beta-1,4-N-acetylglucosaminyltransferase